MEKVKNLFFKDKTTFIIVTVIGGIFFLVMQGLGFLPAVINEWIGKITNKLKGM